LRGPGEGYIFVARDARSAPKRGGAGLTETAGLLSLKGFQ
jgi:hypothetical protein